MKIARSLLFLFFLIASLYTAISWLLPTRIVAVHADGYSSIILVEHFPLRVSGKVTWWKDNQKLLKEKYGLSAASDKDFRSISIWDFGEGYQVKKPDPASFFPSDDTDYLYCFEEMKVAANCIKKGNRLMDIARTQDGIIIFNTNNGMYKEIDGVVSKREVAFQ